MLLLRDKVDRRRVEDLAERDVESLAPSLGAVARALLYREEDHLAREAPAFVAATVPTENLRRVVGEVFEALRGGKTFAKWLNLDMGSGKTHLLTFLLYSLYAYDALAEYLREYKWVDGRAARSTAVFAADLRTPGEALSYLLLFAKSLYKVGEADAARYVEERAKSGQFPEARELAARLRRGSTRVAIIVDELFHGVLTYRDAEDRTYVSKTIAFVMQIMDYLRQFGVPFAVLVASARRDYEDAVTREDVKNDALFRDALRLVGQLARLEPALETEWLSVEEARQIILRKLGARQDVFHKLFDKFIERVVKADSDIPQAHHLRSLIKAMAVFAKNAVENGREVVTPADFSEAVLTALFAGDGGLAVGYKSAYEKAVRGAESAPGDVAEPLRLAINAVFALSVTGRPDQLIEVMKAYKTGRYDPKRLPAVSERELAELLRDLGYAEVQVQKALSLLADVPYVHSVRGDRGYMYFVAPVESVVAVYNRYIEEEYKRLAANGEDMAQFLLSLLKTHVGKYNGLYFAVADSLERLELRQDVMNVVVYTGNEDVAKRLEELQARNLAVVVPTFDDAAVRGAARYQAIYGATGKISADYLLPYQKSQTAHGDKAAEYMRRLIDLELEEIHQALSARYQEAAKALADAITSALRYAYVYKCKISEAGYLCAAEQVEVGAKLEPRVHANVREFSKLLDLLDQVKNSVAADAIAVVGNALKNKAQFVGDEPQARNILTKYVAEAVKRGAVALRRDMSHIPYGGDVYYIPPPVLAKAIEALSKDEVARLAGVEVVKLHEGDAVVFDTLPAQREEYVEPPRLQQQPPPADKVAKVIEEMYALGEGELVLVVKFSKENRDAVRAHLLGLKKHVVHVEVHR